LSKGVQGGGYHKVRILKGKGEAKEEQRVKGENYKNSIKRKYVYIIKQNNSAKKPSKIR